MWRRPMRRIRWSRRRRRGIGWRSADALQVGQAAALHARSPSADRGPVGPGGEGQEKARPPGGVEAPAEGEAVNRRVQEQAFGFWLKGFACGWVCAVLGLG